ncbi:rhodanese-like domain-containing protein [Lacticaseibacillus saniviri]|uniref:Rhodanese-related sulfurtransferase n=1 Tax=Lacticaseibacillus saniviri JCM 17471 = DSM 24301 TaxID=1293598 RepID=A0A0R2N6B2_9LACO|nr:rhodanese-like domain-containing protein [Lacticaseibacillus saniviri]KRO18554.1 rhodanese-related sulfurtransferase [Lacticaseibacillus saniviri JCM 17471 = DSM 24301]MCG4281253.1 rhodanese-like domain-containing protein [Lacticaseibacillus saniviri]
MINFLLILLGAGLIAWAVNWGYLAWQKQQLKAIGGELEPEAFEENMRKAQIIDLREKNEFDLGHILGARSLPYTQLKERMVELRKDLPVYLYDGTGVLSVRAARRLQKNKFLHVYWLKKGYNNWSGKTKANKSLD